MTARLITPLPAGERQAWSLVKFMLGSVARNYDNEGDQVSEIAAYHSFLMCQISKSIPFPNRSFVEHTSKLLAVMSDIGFLGH